MNDDPTMPRIPAPPDVPGAGVAVKPHCRICGDAVDINDPKHHVCVPDPAGVVVAADGSTWTKTTRDAAQNAWQVKEDAFRAAEAAAAAAANPVVP